MLRFKGEQLLVLLLAQTCRVAFMYEFGGLISVIERHPLTQSNIYLFELFALPPRKFYLNSYTLNCKCCHFCRVSVVLI